MIYVTIFTIDVVYVCAITIYAVLSFSIVGKNSNADISVLSLIYCYLYIVNRIWWKGSIAVEEFAANLSFSNLWWVIFWDVEVFIKLINILVNAEVKKSRMFLVYDDVGICFWKLSIMNVYNLIRQFLMLSLIGCLIVVKFRQFFLIFTDLCFHLRMF